MRLPGGCSEGLRSGSDRNHPRMDSRLGQKRRALFKTHSTPFSLITPASLTNTKMTLMDGILLTMAIWVRLRLQKNLSSEPLTQPALTRFQTKLDGRRKPLPIL